MTVVVLSDCPPRLRGDLTKWFVEINTGVYVGRINARVRERLWERICENVHNGKATMVFRAQNEQHMKFLVHNASWEPVDFDGITLMRRPSLDKRSAMDEPSLKKGFSHASHRQMAAHRANAAKGILSDYTVIDIETTGLEPLQDEIIELAALRIRGGAAEAEFSTLVQCIKSLPDGVTELTGLTAAEVASGKPLSSALEEFISFIGNDKLLCHNGAFDQRFLSAACKKLGLPLIRNRIVDTLPIARRKLRGLADNKLGTIATHFGLDTSKMHRALNDCILTHMIYVKLNNNGIDAE